MFCPGFSIKTVEFLRPDGGSLAYCGAECRVIPFYFVNVLTVIDLGPGGREPGSSSQPRPEKREIEDSIPDCLLRIEVNL